MTDEELQRRLTRLSKAYDSLRPHTHSHRVYVSYRRDHAEWYWLLAFEAEGAASWRDMTLGRVLDIAESHVALGLRKRADEASAALRAVMGEPEP